MTTMQAMRNACINARMRTGDDSISTVLKKRAKGETQPMFNISSITFEKNGRSVIVDRSEYMTADLTIAALDAIK